MFCTAEAGGISGRPPTARGRCCRFCTVCSYSTAGPLATATWRLVTSHSYEQGKRRKCCSPLLQRRSQIVIQFPSSESIVRPFSALLCPRTSGSLGGTCSSSAHVRPPFQKHSAGVFVPRGSHSCAASKSSDANSSWIRRFTNISAKRTERYCWSCEHETSTGNGLLCPTCNAIQPLDPTVDFFQIFSVDRSFKVDLKVLEQSYKSLQKKLHPDLAGSKSQREREYSAEQSAHVIQAYFILLRPLSRARYLLGLHGIKVEEEGTIDDPELLMEIMEIRESISEISDAEALKASEAENNDRILTCENELESSFRDEDLKRAVSWTQRLAYYIKVGEEIIRKL